MVWDQSRWATLIKNYMKIWNYRNSKISDWRVLYFTLFASCLSQFLCVLIKCTISVTHTLCHTLLNSPETGRSGWGAFVLPGGGGSQHRTVITATLTRRWQWQSYRCNDTHANVSVLMTTCFCPLRPEWCDLWRWWGGLSSLSSAGRSIGGGTRLLTLSLLTSGFHFCLRVCHTK